MEFFSNVCGIQCENEEAPGKAKPTVRTVETNMSNDAIINFNLWSAVESGKSEDVKKALQEGGNVNQKYPKEWNRTVIFQAAWRGYQEVVLVLMDAGADVNHVDDNTRTALHCAAWKGHTEVTKILVEAGADLNIKNKLGNTPADTARRNNKDDVYSFLVGRTWFDQSWT